MRSQSFKQWLILSMAAGLMVAAGCNSMNSHADREDEHEVKMAIADVPAAVRETLMANSAGATIKTVDHEMKDGKMVYEADAIVGTTNWEILVAEDGKLISKKVDAEKDAGEKDDKEDKDDEKK
jgi:hypothetical protein